MDWSNLIDKAHEANDRHGIPVRGGKKYAQVSTRVELFRREFGGSMSIETDIVKFGAAKGEPVAVKATIRDEAGRVIATGHAYEIVGMGGVNQGAALENCETSAVGRALAFLGIHGGEIASLHEIEAFDRKKGAAQDGQPKFDPAAASARIMSAIQKAQTADELTDLWRRELDTIKQIGGADADKIRGAVKARGEELTQQNEAA